MSAYSKRSIANFTQMGLMCATGAIALIKISLALKQIGETYFYFLLLFVAAVIVYAERRFFVRAEHFVQGEEGEADINFELRNLSTPPYRILKNLVLPGMRDDIDFVVIGPRGVSILETKSYRGSFSIQDGKLQRKTKPVKKDILKQIKRQTSLLSQHLRQVFKGYLPVHPFIIFSNPSSFLRFGKKPIPDTNIITIKREWMIDCIKNQSGALLSDSYIERIANHLRQFERT